MRVGMKSKLLWILCVLCTSADAAAVGRRSAIFCHKERVGPSLLAVRVLADGDLQFGISKWQGSQHFGLFGIAKRADIG